MMKKKILLLSSLALLAVSTAYADPVIINTKDLVDTKKKIKSGTTGIAGSLKQPPKRGQTPPQAQVLI